MVPLSGQGRRARLSAGSVARHRHRLDGDRAEAIRQIDHARMLSPHDPLADLFEMGLAVLYLLEGDTNRRKD